MRLLDCTLRDGGYYTNWDFDTGLVDTYIESLNYLPVEFIEIGYRSPPLKEYLGEYYYCPLYVIERISNKSTKKLCILINEKDVSITELYDLLIPVKPFITLIRLAVDPENFLRSIEVGKVIKQMGFELSFNVMYMSDWHKHTPLMDNLNKLEGIADYLYLVDSYGGIFPDVLIKIIADIRNRTNISLGFHGHNNLELALANSLTAIEHGVELVDCTVSGMGRGAGNLKTELLLTVLQAKFGLNFDFNHLSKISNAFLKIKEKYRWGTNLPYMVSGANSLPQNQVMEWVSKRFFSFNSILQALTNQYKGVKDNYHLPKLNLSNKEKGGAVLIVGGGASVGCHAKAISIFLKSNPSLNIIHSSSRNAMVFKEFANHQYFCLVGNEGHRLEEVYKDLNGISGKCVLPPFPRKMGTYIPKELLERSFELNSCHFTDRLHDTHTALALQTAIELCAENVFVVGYDGYSDVNISQKEQEFFLENEYLFQKAVAFGLSLVSLTKTKYNNLLHGTIYSEL